MLPRSPCEAHGCALCCHDTEMPVTEDDVARLVARGHDRAAFTRRSPEDGVLYLRTVEPAEGMSGRPCFFLKDGRCSAYGDRPQGCRIYPFVLTVDQYLVRDEDCPHRREFPQDPALKRRIQKIAATLTREARAARDAPGEA